MKKLYLEFFRGGSAIFIFAWHILIMAPTGHPTKFTIYWGTDLLMMFFMLSGLVINLTESKKPKTRPQFIANRLLRIYPQFLVGMLMGIAALYITNTEFPSLKVITGNFLMLSTMKDEMGHIVPSIQSNLPVWSLSFEMAFYAFFALTIGRFQKKAIAVWFVASLIAIPLFFLKTERDAVKHILTVLSFSSIWLVGYYIYQYRNYFYAGKYAVAFGLGVVPLISRMHLSGYFYDPLKYFIFSLFVIPFFRYCLQLPPAGKQIKAVYMVVPHLLILAITLKMHYLPIPIAVAYGTFPYLYMGIVYFIDLVKIKKIVVGFINKAGDFSGRFSYPLYITHFPILFVFLSVFNHSVLGFALASIPVAFLVTYILEIWFQPAVTRFFLAKKQQQVTVVPDIKLTDIQGDIPVKKLKNGMPVPDLID